MASGASFTATSSTSFRSPTTVHTQVESSVIKSLPQPLTLGFQNVGHASYLEVEQMLYKFNPLANFAS
jgi:hypothetical protein